MNNTSFDILFENSLRELYHAEVEIIRALPFLAEAAANPELKAAFADHWDQSKEHARRLEQVFSSMNQPPKARESEPIKALIQAGRAMMKIFQKSTALDVALIAAAQQVEHYEISRYTSARALAEALGQNGPASLLGTTLEEEKSANDKLESIAHSILHGESGATNEQKTEPKKRGREKAEKNEVLIEAS